MKILDKYVIQEHVGPLTFALTALTSLLLLNYVAKQFGNLVGKGLPWTVIAEFFMLSVPFTIAMTLPMAVLVSVLYAFSRLASENEITALKASGVGMVRMLIPVLLGATLLAVTMVAFNDQVLPRANHRLRVLQSDIARKKPTFALREQVINEVSPGKLFLRAGHIDENSNRMREVTIYDLSDPTRRRTIYADSGNLAMTPDGSNLELTLYDGAMQEIPKSDPAQLQRLFYDEDRIRVRGVGNQFSRDSTDNFKSDREMSICEMQNAVTTAERDLRGAEHELQAVLVAATRTLTTGRTTPPAVYDSSPPARSLGRGYCRLLAAIGAVPTDTAQPDGGWTGSPSRSAGAAKPAATPAQRGPATTPAARANAEAKAKAVRPRATGDEPRPVRIADYQKKQRSAYQASGAGKTAPARAASPATPDVIVLDSAGRVVRAPAARVSASRPPAARPPAARPPADPSDAAAEEEAERFQPDEEPARPVVAAAAEGARPPILELPPVQTGQVAARLDVLRARLEDSERQMDAYEVEIQKKFALAVACVVFVLLGAPIALRFPRGGVGLTIGVSLGVFALYYVGLIAGESLADRDILSPFWAMWAANVLFTIVGLFLLVRMGKEGSTARGGDMSEFVDALRAWLAKQGRRVGLPLDRRRHDATPQQRAA